MYLQQWLFDIRSRSFVLLGMLFLVITALVYFEITEEIDQSIVSYFADLDNPVLDGVMQSITESGNIFYMLLFAIALLLVPKSRRIGITLMILIVFATLLTGYVKCGIDRDRPDHDYDGISFPVSIGRDTFALFCDGGFFASFPSGHAARSMIFGIILGYALSERFPRGAYLLLIYPVLISFSRVYVLEHYPMDVIGGGVIGVMLAGVLAKKTRLYKIFDRSNV